jgi:thioredoxin 1
MKQITTNELDSEVLRAPVPVLVEFSTESCGPCWRLKPVLEEIKREQTGKLCVVQVDASTKADLAARHSVAAVPALFLYRQGQCVGQQVGFASTAELLKWLHPTASP